MLQRLFFVGIVLCLCSQFVAARAPAPVEERPTLQERLYALDQIRQGADTSFDDVEREGEKLIARYKAPEDRAKIYFELAHVYAQSDIRKYPDRVTKYARLALEAERDPKQRALLYTYLGSAAEVEPGDKSFSELRRNAALHYLAGYKEMLALKLPAKAPALPQVEKYHVDGDPEAEKAARERHEAQMKARAKAEVERDLIEQRRILLEQIVALYQREPHANDELREIAAKVLGDDKAAAKLVGKLGDK